MIRLQSNIFYMSSSNCENDRRMELVVDEKFIDNHGRDIWKGRCGKIKVTTIFNNEPSEKAKKEFNDVFNQVAEKRKLENDR